MKSLTPKQELFALEYIKDFNGTAAAIRAGYSERSARQNAHKMLNNPLIQAAIASAIEQRVERTAIDADWVLRELAKEKRADFADLFDEHGNLLPVKDWPAVWRNGLVVGIESFEEYAGRGEDREAIGMVRKIKLTDRIKHIELIGKHVNVRAFREMVGVSAPNGGPVPIAHTTLTPEQLQQIAEAVIEKF